MKKIIVPIIGALLAVAATPAAAHSAPSILQLGNEKVRVSHSASAGCVDKGGVHVCGALAREANEDNSLLGEGSREQLIIKKTVIVRDGNPPRRLRTQGFFSGKVYRSKRFTQGFFADRIAAEH